MLSAVSTQNLTPLNLGSFRFGPLIGRDDFLLFDLEFVVDAKDDNDDDNDGDEDDDEDKYDGDDGNVVEEDANIYPNLSEAGSLKVDDVVLPKSDADVDFGDELVDTSNDDCRERIELKPIEAFDG